MKIHRLDGLLFIFPLALVFLAASSLALLVSPARAQSLNFGGGEGGLPIEINAEDGIEWQQDNLVFLARGNATAVRGDITVRADTLRAYYRDDGGGGTDIWRLDAEGGVTISTPGETAYGELAIYDVDNQTLVLSGGDRVRLITSQYDISAAGQLEYWEKKQIAVARGDAVAISGGRKLAADVLVAHFRKNAKGDNAIHQLRAFDNVRIVTATEDARAERGIYNVESGIATLTGSVKIIRGPNTLSGCKAEVNLNTGVSKIFSCAAAQGAGTGRVQGVLTPSLRKKKN